MAQGAVYYDDEREYVMTFRKGLPMIVVADGDSATSFTDGFDGDIRLAAMQRAATIARLRTLADLLEGPSREGT